MKKLIPLLLMFMASVAMADVKISDLPLGSAATTGVNDSFPYVDATASVTRRLKISDLPNAPGFALALKRTVATTTTNTSLAALTKDYILNMNTVSGNLVVTLPSAITSDTFCVDVKKIHASNEVTVQTSLGQTIDGSSTDILNTPFESRRYCAVNSNWFIY